MIKDKIIKWGIYLLLPALVTTSGCKKFLDRKPLQQTIDDLSGGVLQSQVFGMYNTVQTYAGFATLPWLDMNSIRDDDAQKGSSSTDGAEINAEFDTYQYTKDDWATDTYWSDHYTMIGQANKTLYFADSLKVKDQTSLRYVGEACFFRAYAFFELVKAYGDVPLINFYYTKATAGNIAKSPVSVIYAQIDSDLNIASQYLPVTWTDPISGTNAYPGRLTKGAANTLWAQTQLFRSNWAQVIGLCKEVVASGQYSLSSTFPSIWTDGIAGIGKNGPESIFESQSFIGQNNTPDNETAWGTCQSVRQGGASTAWNLGWGWNVPTASCVAAWDSTDPRKSQSVLYSGKYDGGAVAGGYGLTLPSYAPGTSLDQPYWNKKVYADPAMRAWTGHITDGNTGWINHRILRYADVLLMLAEASNETGDGVTAAASLELVRKRASGGLAAGRTIVPYIPFVDQAQMRAAIKNERRWEFAFEGYRFYDLVRWGDALSTLGSLGYTARCKLYPIPQPAINASNGKLIQNPDWQ